MRTTPLRKKNMVGPAAPRYKRRERARPTAQTDEQRRAEKVKAKKLTSELRSHLEELEEIDEDNLDPLSNNLEEHFIRSDEQGKKGFTVEHALLDATIFHKLSVYSKQQAAKLQTGLKEYDVKSFVDRLRLSMQSEDEEEEEEAPVLDLTLLGSQVYRYFKATPGIDFMLGQDNFDGEKKKVKRPPKQKEAIQPKQATQRPDEVTEDTGGKTETDKEIEHLYATLKKKGPTVEFYKFLVDPGSFTRTIENIFHVSFLIKEGRAQLNMRKSRPTLTIKELKVDKNGVVIDDDVPESAQMIMRFDQNTFEKVIQEHNITTCALKRRHSTEPATQTQGAVF